MASASVAAASTCSVARVVSTITRAAKQRAAFCATSPMLDPGGHVLAGIDDAVGVQVVYRYGEVHVNRACLQQGIHHLRERIRVARGFCGDRLGNQALEGSALLHPANGDHHDVVHELLSARQLQLQVAEEDGRPLLDNGIHRHCRQLRPQQVRDRFRDRWIGPQSLEECRRAEICLQPAEVETVRTPVVAHARSKWLFQALEKVEVKEGRGTLPERETQQE
ncbi:MAG: hypothetical protein MZV64_28640 [Ignavibacteriales bacterium]|nr:hypothetical protein [Ignavibacteriales bacterium]